ncbi:MAG: hypothetical protein AAB682_00040 [Patescibacteria group bacterium]
MDESFAEKGAHIEHVGDFATLPKSSEWRHTLIALWLPTQPYPANLYALAGTEFSVVSARTIFGLLAIFRRKELSSTQIIVRSVSECGSSDCSPSRPSMARYVLEYSAPGNPGIGILGQILKGVTSSHFHSEQLEYYFPVHNEAVLTLGRDQTFDYPRESVMKVGEIHRIPLCVAHELRSARIFKQILVCVGHPHGLTKLDHHYVQSHSHEIEAMA